MESCSEEQEVLPSQKPRVADKVGMAGKAETGMRAPFAEGPKMVLRVEKVAGEEMAAWPRLTGALEAAPLCKVAKAEIEKPMAGTATLLETVATAVHPILTA